MWKCAHCGVDNRDDFSGCYKCFRPGPFAASSPQNGGVAARIAQGIASGASRAGQGLLSGAGDYLERRYKTLHGLTSFIEVVGWLVCLTIIFIPFGLLMVIAAQAARVSIDIEDNTRKTHKVLAEILAELRRSGDGARATESTETFTRPQVAILPLATNAAQIAEAAPTAPRPASSPPPVSARRNADSVPIACAACRTSILGLSVGDFCPKCGAEVV